MITHVLFRAGVYIHVAELISHMVDTIIFDFEQLIVQDVYRIHHMKEAWGGERANTCPVHP